MYRTGNELYETRGREGKGERRRRNLTWGLTGKILSTSLLYLGRSAAQHQQQPRIKKIGIKARRRVAVRSRFDQRPSKNKKEILIPQLVILTEHFDSSYEPTALTATHHEYRDVREHTHFSIDQLSIV